MHHADAQHYFCPPSRIRTDIFSIGFQSAQFPISMVRIMNIYFNTPNS